MHSQSSLGQSNWLVVWARFLRWADAGSGPLRSRAGIGVSHILLVFSQCWQRFAFTPTTGCPCLFICTVGVVKTEGRWLANDGQGWEGMFDGSRCVESRFRCFVSLRLKFSWFLSLIQMHFPGSCYLHEDLGKGVHRELSGWIGFVAQSLPGVVLS